MELTTVWFILIAVLWIGYFCLEGFDFGVGMLLPVLARDDRERRLMINTIGPVWDGNEVWLLIAGGATFAAFPEWYATLFSGFYLPLLLILLALIVRGLAFEYRHQRPEASLALPLGPGDHRRLLRAGPAVGRGLRQHRARRADRCGQGVHRHRCFTLLNPFGLLGGVMTLLLFLTHGAMFLALKTDGDIRHRARALASSSASAAAVAAVVFLVWAQIHHRQRRLGVLFVVAALALVGGTARRRVGREGWAFLGTFVTIALAVAGLFVALFPDVMPSTHRPGVLADHHQRGGDPLHADDDDRGGGDVHPARAGLPGAGPTGSSASGSRVHHIPAAGRGGAMGRRPTDPRVAPPAPRPRVARSPSCWPPGWWGACSWSPRHWRSRGW